MLIDEIKKANVEAMKRHDAAAKGAYSLIIARYQALLTSGSGKEITDSDVVHILQKFSKELDEEMQGYLAAGRKEQADTIAAQKEAVALYLPKMLSEEEVRAIISSLDDKSIPSVMKYFKANYEGKADMGMVNKILRSM